MDLARPIFRKDQRPARPADRPGAEAAGRSPAAAAELARQRHSRARRTETWHITVIQDNTPQPKFFGAGTTTAISGDAAFLAAFGAVGEAIVSIGSRCRSLVPQPPTAPPWINWRQPPLQRVRQYQVARNFPWCPSPPLWRFSAVRYSGLAGFAVGATPRKKSRHFFRGRGGSERCRLSFLG